MPYTYEITEKELPDLPSAAEAKATDSQHLEESSKTITGANLLNGVENSNTCQLYLFCKDTEESLESKTCATLQTAAGKDQYRRGRACDERGVSQRAMVLEKESLNSTSKTDGATFL